MNGNGVAADAIDVSGLVKCFDTRAVLASIDLRVPRGQVIGLPGPNGSGKSTRIKCLLGLLKADEGSATVLGTDAWQLADREKARIGYVPQEATLYPWLTVSQTVAYVSSFYSSWDRAWGEELLRRWDLPLGQRVGPLSVGQKQKLALVLALGHRPELLILDEPVASLDPVARRWFLETVLETAGAGAGTVLFSTHITSDLERVASHVALLREGKVTFHDEIDVLKDRVKRLRIEAQADLPADLHLPGTLRQEVHGRQALVTVDGVDAALVAGVRERFAAEVVVDNLNLEEIFLELHDREAAATNRAR
ncbi:MAG: ABC transporter ATP-binding protein [Planctomycetaceae bacterium]|nr:ABC transporter ATP-binding protein [Planctomycetaceae bacterium]